MPNRLLYLILAKSGGANYLPKLFYNGCTASV
jgi:hypothetical protein